MSLEDGDDYVSDGEGEAAARARQDEEDATAADLFPGEVVLPKNVAPVLRRRSARKVAAA
ncbi:hypothetical protein EON68_02925 [archaeon]|nr:MAG: hypothetical protein EON68_02925 [archaeon]